MLDRSPSAGKLMKSLCNGSDQPQASQNNLTNRPSTTNLCPGNLRATSSACVSTRKQFLSWSSGELCYVRHLQASGTSFPGRASACFSKLSTQRVRRMQLTLQFESRVSYALYRIPHREHSAGQENAHLEPKPSKSCRPSRKRSKEEL